MNDAWVRISKGRYAATINGRRFTLICNRKTRSSVIRTSWVTVGRKPRSYTTVTWYSVYENVGGAPVSVVPLGDVPPGNLAEAKALAMKAARKP